MGIFRKRLVFGIWNDRGILAERIEVWLLSFQRKLADRINCRLASMPLNRLTVYFTLSAVGIGLYCFWLVVRAFF